MMLWIETAQHIDFYIAFLPQVVAKVMSCCKEDYLQSVADSASYFMEEKKMKSAVRESSHQKERKVKGKVHIEGAALLVITFDKWLALEINGS